MPFRHLQRTFLLCGVLYLSFLPIQAQDLTFSGLEEVLRYAKLHAPEQKIRDLKGIQQEYTPKMSRSELLPTLRAYGTWDNYLQLPVQLLPSEAVGGEPGTFTEIRFGTQYQINLGLEATLPLFDPELWSRIKTDRLRSQMNLEEFSSQEQNWTEGIARAYYQLLLHSESLKLAEERFHLSDSIYHLAELSYQAGEMEPLPYQRIQASALAAKNALHRQQKQEDLAKSSLRKLIGSREGNLILIEDIQNSSPVQRDLDYAFESQPEWKKADLELQMNEQNWKQSRASHLPKLSGSGRFYQQTLGNNFNLSDASRFEVGVIGLSLNWNVFQGNLKRLKTKSAYMDWQIAREQQQVTRDLLAEEKTNLTTDLRQNELLVAGFGPMLQLYAENFRLAGLQWSEGEISADELLQVEREWIEQQQEYLIALSNLYTAKALIAIRNLLYSENP
jgi:outer membrane protein